MTGWTTREAAGKCGLSQHTLRWYERSGLPERIALLRGHRERVREALLEQQECLKLLDAKIGNYCRRIEWQGRN